MIGFFLWWWNDCTLWFCRKQSEAVSAIRRYELIHTRLIIIFHLVSIPWTAVAAKEVMDKNFATLADNHEQLIRIKDSFKVCVGSVNQAECNIITNWHKAIAINLSLFHLGWCRGPAQQSARFRGTEQADGIWRPSRTTGYHRKAQRRCCKDYSHMQKPDRRAGAPQAIQNVGYSMVDKYNVTNSWYSDSEKSSTEVTAAANKASAAYVCIISYNALFSCQCRRLQASEADRVAKRGQFVTDKASHRSDWWAEQGIFNELLW